MSWVVVKCPLFCSASSEAEHVLLAFVSTDLDTWSSLRLCMSQVHSSAVLIPNFVQHSISIFFFSTTILIASIIGSDLKGMNIKAKNPS